jgi:hypothetical protein
MEVVFPFDVEKFFNKCVANKYFPKNDFEKQAVLLMILKDFSDEVYDEEVVNGLIHKYFSDDALIRRELINFGYMQRDPRKGKYWVVKRVLTDADIKANTRLKQHYEAYKGKII